MTRLGGIRNNVGGGGGAAGARGSGDRAPTVQLKDLPLEEQRAFELLESLRDMNELALRRRILEAAGASDPVGIASLRAIASMYAVIGFPLSVAGVARFKQDRGFTGGTSLSGPVAKAYARALDGNEIIVRVDRAEERALRPSERACLDFLREMSRRCGADELRPVKQCLGLGNPPLPKGAAVLENEYVGIQGLKEIAHATTMRELPLSRDGLRRLVAAIAEERKAEKKKP
jgi:hypothetical protein